MNSIEHTTIATLAPTAAHRRAVAVVDLCSGLSPMWGRLMSTSRVQSEIAVTQSLKAFADIGPLIDMAERQSAQINDALAQPVDGIEGLVAALEQISKPIQHETQMVAVQVQRMYMGFQYQDRISQMLPPLEGDVAHLQSMLANPGTTVSGIDSCLPPLESQYVMVEQHQVQKATGIGDTLQDNYETTFF